MPFRLLSGPVKGPKSNYEADYRSLPVKDLM